MKWLSIQAKKYRLPGAICLGLVLILAFLILPFSALAETFAQSFKSKDSLEPGWVVALDEKDGNSVELAPANDPGRMYGVVIDPSQIPFTIQRQPGQQVFVATTGTYQVLVNTQGGEIKPGDHISMSHTNGIASKATSSQSYVLGRAIEKFDGKNNVITKTSDGQSLGRIQVTIAPSKNPLVQNDVAVPGTLKRIGEGIAGKDVAAIRVYTALAIFAITAVVSSIVLWVGVRGGMVAIGRNPLSRRYIIRGLIQVIVIAILIFTVGVVGVYLLIRL